MYDKTTAYIRRYNQARLLNRSAARFAMTIFQRRLASSTWALLRSLRNRLRNSKRSSTTSSLVASGVEQLREQQRRLDRQVRDTLDEKTADEEGVPRAASKSTRRTRHRHFAAFVATNLAELVAEREKVRGTCWSAEAVYARGLESKFEKLRELLRSPEFEQEKVIIYTEHRDTLDFLMRRLEAMGYAGQVAYIHGGLDFEARDAQVELFRRPHGAKAGQTDQARFFIGTDAAAEGINLQFCWCSSATTCHGIRREAGQRMGRIHRYGQKKDRVAILNLVAGKTCEGRVVQTLLNKMEESVRNLRSDKVFDVIGRIFEGLSPT